MFSTNFVFCGFLLLLVLNQATAHIEGSNITQLFLESTSSSFLTLRSVQIFNLASAPQYAPSPALVGPAFLLSSQEAINSSSLRSAGVQIFLGPNNSTGPIDIWNLTSFYRDPAASLWSISTYQGLSDVIVAVSMSFNLSSSWDLPDKYLLWGKYSIAGFPPKLDGLPHRWHDPGPAEPIFNSTSQQFDSFSTPEELDLFCSRTPTPGVKIRRTPTSIFMLSRSFGSLKLIRYDSQTMNPLWKRVIVPRVEPFGCAHTATSRFVNMMAVDPTNDDVWVLFTPNSPDAMQSFLQYNNLTLPEGSATSGLMSILMGIDKDNNRLHWEVVEPKNGSCEPVPWVRGDIAVAPDRKRVAVVTSCLDQMDGGRHLDRGWIKVTSFLKNETHQDKLHVETQNKYTLLDLDADSVSLSSAVYHTKSILVIAGEAGYRTDSNNGFTQGGDGFISLFDSAAGGTMSMQRFYMGQRRTRRNSITSIIKEQFDSPSNLPSSQTYYLTANLDGPLMHDSVQTQKTALYEIQIPTQVEAETPMKLWIVIGITAAVFVILGCVGILVYIRNRRQQDYKQIQ